MSVISYIGLGSNLGDSLEIMAQAVNKLSTLGHIKVSQLYQSSPMGPQDQPNFYNAVVQLETDLEPLALLDELQRFENESGRVRLRRWGERTLDLDLLLYAEKNIINERLTVPHIGILERDFVLIPLLDLDPQLQVDGKLLRDLDIIKNTDLVVLANSSWANVQ